MLLKANSSDWQTRIRLWAAITMAVYAIGYNIYYAAGLISSDAMEGYLDLAGKLWPFFFVIPIVILVHVSLGLWKLFRRNTFKMPLWEIAQIVLGASIPFFLLPHVVYTYGMFLFFGVQQNYIDDILKTYPHFAWQYTAMTLAIWTHAQIGAHAVLRMRKWYPKIKYVIIAVFVIMPVIGIAGYFKGAYEIQTSLRDPQWVINENVNTQPPTPEQANILKTASYSVYIIFPALYLIVLAARGIRIKRNNTNKNSTVIYSSGESVSVFPNTTILEASRIGNIPHASICGGRGRCTTCRIRVDEGMENLSPVGEREYKALKRIGANEQVRLACQSVCNRGQVSVTLLLPPDIKSLRARKETKYSAGTEMELVVMFTDLRGFTRFSEGKFPYDVVFVLNRYFSYMGEVIEKNGGKIDKFLGDGILAFFGFETNSEAACKQALVASKQMAEKLKEINEQLKHALPEPLKIGIGLHCGEVILGEIGYKDKSSLTIIGDTVNTASRLEALNKKTESQMIFSKKVAELSHLDTSRYKKYNANIRGKQEPLEIYIVKDIIRDL